MTTKIEAPAAFSDEEMAQIEQAFLANEKLQRRMAHADAHPEQRLSWTDFKAAHG